MVEVIRCALMNRSAGEPGAAEAEVPGSGGDGAEGATGMPSADDILRPALVTLPEAGRAPVPELADFPGARGSAMRPTSVTRSAGAASGAGTQSCATGPAGPGPAWRKRGSALEEQRNGEWRYLEFLQVTGLIRVAGTGVAGNSGDAGPPTPSSTVPLGGGHRLNGPSHGGRRTAHYVI
jgi:hypothetical protein